MKMADAFLLRQRIKSKLNLFFFIPKTRHAILLVALQIFTKLAL
jgi:hypothetical protein